RSVFTICCCWSYGTRSFFPEENIPHGIIGKRLEKRSSDSFVRFLRTLNFIDALVSVLTLQNTLIMVFADDKGGGLFTLTAVTSGIIWLAIVLISIAVLINGIRELKTKE
ncbi:MAG: hypothetical protein Q4B55_02210, partial [Lachnospiraceae bacterium]|nr:hypothetical protein [Lachnospiraceae bacterium]